MTHRLFEEPRAKLGEYFDAESWSDSDRPQRSEVLRRVADKDGLICLLTEKIDDELLAAAPRLRIVANVAVGFDNIDVAACTRRKVAVTNTPGVLDETTADFAWTLLMAVARRLIEGDALARSGGWRGWNLDQLCGADVWGKTLGLVGFGRIGRAVARRASGFGMRVLYSDRARAPREIEDQFRAEYAERDELLRQADFVSLHVPLLADTQGLDRRARTGADEADGVPHQHFAGAGGARGGAGDGAREKADCRGGAGRLRARTANQPRLAAAERGAGAASGVGDGGDANANGDDGGGERHGVLRRPAACESGESGSMASGLGRNTGARDLSYKPLRWPLRWPRRSEETSWLT